MKPKQASELKKFICFTLVTLLFISGLAGSVSYHTTKPSKNNEIPSPDYNETTPVRIDNNDELAAFASSGNGSESNPFIIQGYQIDGSGHGYCMYIGNTTHHFVVRDCYLSNATGYFNEPYFFESGLELYKVVNGSVINNTFSGCDHDGLLFYKTDDSIAKYNNASNNVDGIYLKYSDNNRVYSNNVSRNNNEGIELYDSEHNHIYENNVYENNYKGIFVLMTKNNKIYRNEIYSNEEGIFFLGGNDHEIMNNSVYNNTQTGMEISSSRGNHIYNNTITNSPEGLYIFASTYHRVFNNTMVNCGIQIYGTDLNKWNTHQIPTSNKVNGKPVYYFKNSTNVIVPKDAGQIILAKCYDTNLDQFDISNTSTAISVGYSENITISNCNLSSCGSRGLKLYNTNYSEVHKSIFDNNRDGVYFYNSHHNNLYNSCFMNNNHTGIWISISDHHYAGNNTVCGSEYGMYLTGNHNIIENNSLVHNTNGSYIYSSDDSTIIYNNIVDNYRGFILSSSENNAIHHNNFIDNDIQARDTWNNQWDDGYPSGGNHWSDYGGGDIYSGANQDQPGSDGIGDSPYSIPNNNNEDRYPLMNETNFMLKINKGWNYVSMPWVDSSISVDRYLSNIFYDKAMVYHDSEWYTYVPSRSSHFNQGFPDLDNKYGIWIHSTHPNYILGLKRNLGTTDTTLDPGWNMVGYPSNTDRLASDALPSEVSKIGVFNASRDYNLEYIFDLTTYTMVAGEGYWVYNDADCSVVWTVNY